MDVYFRKKIVAGFDLYFRGRFPGRNVEEEIERKIGALGLRGGSSWKAEVVTWQNSPPGGRKERRGKERVEGKERERQRDTETQTQSGRERERQRQRV